MAFDICKILKDLMVRHNSGRTFRYKGANITMEQLCSPVGVLPIIVRRASLLADFLYERSLVVSYQPDAQSLSGERVVFNHEHQDSFELLMILYDIIEEYITNSPDQNLIDIVP